MASYRYERDIDPKDLTPRKKRAYTRKERWANWWDYNLKWVIILGIAAAFVGYCFIGQYFLTTHADYNVAVVAPHYLPEATQTALQDALAAYGEDRNGDGKVVVKLNVYTMNFGSDDSDAYLDMAGTTKLSTDIQGALSSIFILYDPAGFQSTTGTLKITSGRSSGSTTAKGDITYTVKAGSEVSFDEDDFQKLYDKSCSGSFKYLEFDRPGTDYTSAGSVYSRYGKKNETAFSRSDFSNTTFGYSDYDDGDYDLSNLSFVADKSFSGSITLNFTLYGGTGSKTNQSTTGTLVITTGSGSSGSLSFYAGNIRLSTTAGSALQINPNDIARYFKKVSGGRLMYVTLTSLPTTGTLYYNYYGTSKYGVSTRTQMTTSNIVGRIFSFSPAANTEYALSELTYIPSGANYCTPISFVAYGDNGQSASGTILISVTNKAVPEIYSVTGKGTSVNFPASSISAAVSTATGATLSGIQLLDLPSASKGTVYAGSVAANTTSQYSYDTISQLRFVPASTFTGSVTLPYVALNSNGTALGIGQFSIGVVSSVKKFSDVTTSTWCYKYVTELSGDSIISGYSNGSFQEKNTITYQNATTDDQLVLVHQEG